ncbi:MAG: YidC/Oxa1 family membrane protein insertase [Clostridia bacterium]|nr:YidC/Oxa1 family membrane protein insertase [Clostridia bacterium]MDD4665324.1 YidC/Oxa1 family membrane protein insertase [Clostridia bacterium]
MWQSLVNGVAALLRILYEITVNIGIPSYALAIFLLTLLIRVVLYPLNNKQLTSTKKMQEIQPKLKEIQKKYKNNPEKANQEVIKVYKENKVNPMAGCLPLLIQMPIIIALFQALRQFEYTDLGATFFWIPHLKNPDPLMILPVVVGIATYFQSKVSMANTENNPQAAATQKTMLYVMPLMIGWMSTKFPAGLCLYWIFYSLTGIIQQIFVNRRPTLRKGEVGGVNE